MAQKPLSILISGAGVAGVSLALMLARHPSFTTKPIITLVERSPVPRTTGQAIDIRGPAVDVIRDLGLEPEIKARHTSETGLAILNTKGDIIAQIDATGDAKKQSATSEYEILRGELAGLLLDGVKKAQEKGAEVQVVHGESVESMQDSDHGIHVKFEHGKLPPQRYDLVVGADGIASTTRSMIFGEEYYRDHVKPSGMYLGFFSIPRVPEDDQLWRTCSLPSGMSMHLRPHRTKGTMGAYFIICNPTKERNPELEEITHSDVAAQKNYLKKRFQGAGWQSERLIAGLDGADDFYMSHWCQVVTPQWTKGRYIILGDSAFATMGIGTSLAMIGAYTMAGELSKIESPEQVSAALQRYEDIFRQFTSKYESIPLGFPQLANPQTALGVSLLHMVVKIAVVLRLPQFFTWYNSGEGKEDWKLPDYGWKKEQLTG